MEKAHLDQLIEQIRIERHDAFQTTEEPVAVIIHFDDGNSAYYSPDKTGITEHATEHATEPAIDNKVIASYGDLLKARKSNIQLVRFLSTGRIQLRGDVKMLMRNITTLLG